MLYLSSAFSLNMLDLENIPDGSIRYEVVPIEKARELVNAGTVVNVIGHQTTAAIIGEQLYGKPMNANRANVSMSYEDKMLVAQYYGDRLPEGATELPAGAKIVYILVYIRLGWYWQGNPNTRAPRI